MSSVHSSTWPDAFIFLPIIFYRRFLSVLIFVVLLFFFGNYLPTLDSSSQSCREYITYLVPFDFAFDLVVLFSMRHTYRFLSTLALCMFLFIHFKVTTIAYYSAHRPTPCLMRFSCHHSASEMLHEMNFTVDCLTGHCHLRAYARFSKPDI